MPGLVDANLLLYAANSVADEHAAAAGFLHAAGTSPDSWYLTEGILYEFLRVATHPKVFPRPLSGQQAMEFLKPFLTVPAFSITAPGERHWSVLERMVEEMTHPAGNLFNVIRTVALSRLTGPLGKQSTRCQLGQPGWIR